MTTSSPPPQPPPNQLRILVVRHGETHENAAGIVQGQLDTDLNAFGRLQAATTARHLSTVRFDRIITSPLRRARDTAQAVLEQQPASSNLRLEQDSRLKERGLGVLEGKKWAAPANRSEEDTSSFEHKHHLLERVASFWNELVTFPAVSPSQLANNPSPDQTPPANQHDHDHDNEKTILLVSHGATISALMDELLLAGQYLHAPPDIRHWRENCCITEIVVPTISDHRVSPPATSKPTNNNINIDPKETWTIRPLHLGVQGAQRLLEIKNLESNLAHLRRRRHAASADDTTALETQIQTLQASLNLSHADLEKNGIRKSLEEDVLRGPDGREVTQDLGYGKGVGYIVKWADTTHLQGLMNDDDGMEGDVLEHSHHAPINVDELVEKSDPTV
jgi:broad specificity phosphatase PhoE